MGEPKTLTDLAQRLSVLDLQEVGVSSEGSSLEYFLRYPSKNLC